MKKAVLLLLIAFCLTGTLGWYDAPRTVYEEGLPGGMVTAGAGEEEEKGKEFVIKLKHKDLADWWVKLVRVQQIADSSNLPHQDVKFIVQAIEGIKIEIDRQLKPQVDTVQGGKQRRGPPAGK